MNVKSNICIYLLKAFREGALLVIYLIVSKKWDHESRKIDEIDPPWSTEINVLTYCGLYYRIGEDFVVCDLNQLLPGYFEAYWLIPMKLSQNAGIKIVRGIPSLVLE